MSGLTNTIEITRSGRNLISKLMKGVAASGISHVAVGSGTGGSYSLFGTNSRMGNNLEMTGTAPVIVHNDFPVYNFTGNGIPNAFYFVEQANTQTDLTLGFGSDSTGGNILRQNHFNHLFLVHMGSSGPYGLGEVVNFATGTPAMPSPPSNIIIYIGYVEADAAVKTFYNPARLFNELGRNTSVTVDFLGDRAINGTLNLEFLQPNLVDTSLQPNPSVLVRAPFSLGVTNTIREIAILGDNGNDILAWAPLVPGTAITPGQGIFIRWALGF
jgi:hypothetical protein